MFRQSNGLWFAVTAKHGHWDNRGLAGLCDHTELVKAMKVKIAVQVKVDVAAIIEAAALLIALYVYLGT